jgi:hypothetical protein
MNRFGHQGRSLSLSCLWCSVLLVGFLSAGCRTPSCSEQNFAKPFDARQVAELSHNSYKVAWEASFCAREDLKHLSYRPTVLDWEAVNYVNRLLRQAPWIAHDIETNPNTPRCSSKSSYDMVAFDAVMLKARYSPTSFTRHTDGLIERLIQLTDQISSYYELKTPEGLPSQK